MCLFLKTLVSVLCVLSFLVSHGQQLKPVEYAIPGSSVKFRMVPVPGGSFTIGASGGEADEAPQKRVTISPFYMSEHEVTFAEWDVFFKSVDVPQTKAIKVDAVSRPTAQYIDLTWGMGRDPLNPTNSMSQTAAIMYCKWMYEKTGVFFRLPTEAEWEYACRAGSKDRFPSGVTAASLAMHAYYKDNSAGKYQKVKQLKPNAWGLYDMLGNLSEWTLDQYLPNAYAGIKPDAKDPLIMPVAKYPRVARGGSYLDDASEISCTNRIPSKADWNQRDPQIPKSRWWLTDGMFMGFRLVRPVEQPSEEEINKFFAALLK